MKGGNAFIQRLQVLSLEPVEMIVFDRRTANEERVESTVIYMHKPARIVHSRLREGLDRIN
jgi:hypothetical protein